MRTRRSTTNLTALVGGRLDRRRERDRSGEGALSRSDWVCWNVLPKMSILSAATEVTKSETLLSASNIFATLALVVAVWSAWYSARQGNKSLRAVEKRNALISLTQVVGELARHFTSISLVTENVRDPILLEKILKPLIDSYNDKEVTTKFGDSTLLLPEHDDEVIATQEKFLFLNTTLMNSILGRVPISEEEALKLKESTSALSVYYHKLRGEVRK